MRPLLLQLQQMTNRLNAAERAPPREIQIWVNVPNEATIALDVNLTDIIATVKAKILEKKGIPLAEQRLLFCSKQMEDGRTLASYDVQDGSTIFMVYNLRGGAGGIDDSDGDDGDDANDYGRRERQDRPANEYGLDASAAHTAQMHTAKRARIAGTGGPRTMAEVLVIYIKLCSNYHTI
jgi:ubiquitin